MSDENADPGQHRSILTPSSKLMTASLGAVSTPSAATSNSSVGLLSMPTSGRSLGAPLTPRNFDSPRRVVRVEYDTPRFLPSPANLQNSTKRPARSLRANPTPRRIITVAVDGVEEEHRGKQHLDIISHLLERACVHLIQCIFYYLEPTDFSSVRLVSSKWRKAFRSDSQACQRHKDYIQGMKLYVRSVGIENVPSQKEAKEPATAHTQRASVRTVLTDLSNMSGQRKEKKTSKPLTSTSTAPARLGVTPRRPTTGRPESKAMAFAVMTPEEAAKKAKKISSAKKESRMRRLRC